MHLLVRPAIALAMNRRIYSLNIPEVEISKDGKELIVTRSLLATVLEIVDKKQRAESEDMANKPSIYPIMPNKISIVRTDNNQYEYRVDDKVIVTVDFRNGSNFTSFARYTGAEAVKLKAMLEEVDVEVIKELVLVYPADVRGKDTKTLFLELLELNRLFQGNFNVDIDTGE